MTMKREVSDLGTHEGAAVQRYTLTNESGVSVSVLNYGATLASVVTPDAEGRPGEITLTLPDLESYEINDAYLGATIGRCANRIAKGIFELDGETYSLAVNNGPNHLHGGISGFDKRVWSGESGEGPEGAHVVFTRTSENGEEGYPGRLHVQVTYTLTVSNELIIDYIAETDRRTPVNLTNHTYWNLDGPGGTTVLDHELRLHCSRYIPVDETLIPTGEMMDVSGTAMDFTSRKRIGSEMEEVPGGYDHCFVVDPSSDNLAPVAVLYAPASGRQMHVFSTMPGVQFYTGNFLDGKNVGPDGVAYDKHAGMCLETEYYPDSINQPSFPSVVLDPGEQYRQRTLHRFLSE